MNTRRDTNGKSLKAWRAMGPGLIVKPLRHISNRTNGYNAKGQIVLSAAFKESARAARYGQGHIVSQYARQLGA